MSGKKNKFTLFFKVVLVLLLLTTIPTITFAQGDPPADGCDPFDGCPVPLDTWVLLLAIVAVIYGAYRLNKKQKNLAAQ